MTHLRMSGFMEPVWRREIRNLAEFGLNWLDLDHDSLEIVGYDGGACYLSDFHSVWLPNRRDRFKRLHAARAGVAAVVFHELRHAWQAAAGKMFQRPIDSLNWSGSAGHRTVAEITWGADRFLSRQINLRQAKNEHRVAVWRLAPAECVPADDAALAAVAARLPLYDSEASLPAGEVERRYRALPWEQDADEAAARMVRDYAAR